MPLTPNPQPSPQPPMGTTAATSPTANHGYEVAAQQGMGVIEQALTRLLPMVGASSEMGKDILTMLKLTSKHVPPGAVTPAAAKNEMEKAQFGNLQNMAQMQRLRAQQMQAPPGQTPGAQPAAPMMQRAA